MAAKALVYNITMNILRIVLIIGILSLISFIVALFLFQEESAPNNNVPASNATSTNGQQQDVTYDFVNANLSYEEDFLQSVVIEAVQTPPLLTDWVPEPSAEFNAITSEFFLDFFGEATCTADETFGRIVWFAAKPTNDPNGNNFRPAIAAADNWIPVLMSDIGTLLFPEADRFEIASAEFKGRLALPGITELSRVVTDYSQLEYQAGDQTYYVYYTWFNNYMLFSDSIDCLKAEQVQTYDMHAI